MRTSKKGRYVIEGSKMFFVYYQESKKRDKSIPLRKSPADLGLKLKPGDECYGIFDEGAFVLLSDKPLEAAKPAADNYPKQAAASVPGHGAGDAAAGNGFFNPYYFIPMPSRKTEHELLGDAGPDGPPAHGLLGPGRYHGRIKVRMTVETPLLLPDAQRRRKEVLHNGKEHYTYPVREVDGEPYISPAGLKGMLRSAYEAVTNSRLGVFNDEKVYGRRTGYRGLPQEALDLVPARIESVDDKLKVRLLPGKATVGKDGKRSGGNMYAAVVDCYDSTTKKPLLKELPTHGSQVWFNSGTIKNNQVFTSISALGPAGASGMTQGWLCRTGPNTDKKHCERIFFDASNSSTYLPLTDQVKQSWTDLIADYQEQHRDEIAQGLTKPPVLINRNCRWSRQITGGPIERELSDGTLCYARIEGGARGLQVTALYPVLISRHVCPDTPQKTMEASDQKHHLPAGNLDELSPADRVFGWVNANGRGAYRGNLRIGHVQCVEGGIEKFEHDPLTLSILGAPKHSQTRFYLGDKEGKPFMNGSERGTTVYREGMRLRGRKVYPHQRHSAAYWRGADGPGKFFRQTPGADAKSDQNRSVTGWVKEKTVFEFDIHLSNLSPVEMGALVWLLSLPEGCFHRLGGGKPLGFGSVRLDMDTEASCILSTEKMKAYYSSLTASPEPDELAGLAEEFAQVVRETYGNDILDAFLAAAAGFPGNRTHYPRLHPGREADIFEWFSANEKERGGKRSLPSLAGNGDKSLPYAP